MTKPTQKDTLRGLIYGALILTLAFGYAGHAWGDSGEVHASIAIPSGIGATICGGLAKIRGLPVYELERICILEATPEKLAAEALRAVPDLDMENIPDVTISRGEAEQLQAWFAVCAYSSYRDGMPLPALQDICIRPDRDHALREGEKFLKRARSRAGIREKSL